MKAVSIKQPWASLICTPREDNPILGIKDIENRTWRTRFRGRVYVHVSGKITTKSKFISLIELYRIGLTEEMILDANSKKFDFNNLVYSAIIGEVDIVDCVINHSSIWAEKTPMNHYPIPKDKLIYNWVLANPVLYDKPILNVKGKLSFWEFQPLKL